MQGCYLLHFERVVHGAQHYLGWSIDIARRVRTHLNGRGARLVRQALRAGVAVELVRVWPAADRKHERLLKVRAPKRHCPKCRIAPDAANEALRTLLLAAEPRANGTRVRRVPRRGHVEERVAD
jgi:predicted GIY-YIG superfamily endonuclease